MKKLLIFTIALVGILGLSSCSDDYLYEQVESLNNRVSTLELQVEQIEDNLSSLQSIVEALQNNDYITSITPVKENGVEVGYKITFAKGKTITIYHGTDGKASIIGVKQDTDGVYYWTLDNEWLLDDNGNKIQAVGNTPQLKTEDGYLFISYDNGATWTQLGTDPISVFKSVTQDDNYVYFELHDGTILTISKSGGLDITFENGELIDFPKNASMDVHYTIHSNSENITIEVIPSADLKAKVVTETDTTGYINIQTSATVDEYTKVTVLVSDGDKVIMKTLRKRTYEYVDLGLPSGTLWATTNIGASSVTEIGSLFAWGETTTKTEYTWGNYKFGTGISNFTKYVSNTMYGGTPDDKTTLEAEDDAATVNWGVEWRTPTYDDFNELLNNCDMVSASVDGVSGCKFKSKTDNSKYIFLPYNDYWTATLETSLPSKAETFSLGYSITGLYFSESRCTGLPIRPVRSR